MVALKLALWLGASWAGASSSTGDISGVVVNASQGGAAVPRAEVMLREMQDGQFVLRAETVADEAGRFHFDDLPLGRQHLYLPGANRDSIHYPGPRLQLIGTQPHGQVTLEVRDTLKQPSPLVCKKFEVQVRPESGVLQVTESLLINNPTATTYVGQPAEEGAAPVTLSLSIPREFERTTFFQEFYGRRFTVVDGKLVTAIPWTPGDRELKYRYTLKNEARYRVWERPLDLPCEAVTVRVLHSQPDEVACSLTPTPATSRGEQVFEVAGQVLPAGHVIRVQLGRLPISWTTYAKWGALLILVGSVSATGLAVLWRRRRTRIRPAGAETAVKPQVIPPPSAAWRRALRKKRRRVAS